MDNDSIKQFNKLRKRDVNIKTLVTSFDGEEKQLYFYHNRSAINTISKSLADKRMNKHKEIKTIKGISLNSIIEKSKYKNSKINLLTIDIENYEYDALKNFNFEQYNVDVIVAEITDTDVKNLETCNQSLDFILKSNLYKLLIKKNYRLVNWVNADLIFVNKNNKL